MTTDVILVATKKALHEYQYQAEENSCVTSGFRSVSHTYDSNLTVTLITPKNYTIFPP